jgi:hypothetical protein
MPGACTACFVKISSILWWSIYPLCVYSFQTRLGTTCRCSSLRGAGRRCDRPRRVARAGDKAKEMAPEMQDCHLPC